MSEVEIIREIHRNEGALNIHAVKRNQPRLLAAAFEVRPFLGWRDALAKAGLNYRSIKCDLESYIFREISGEECLNTLKEGRKQESN